MSSLLRLEDAAGEIIIWKLKLKFFYLNFQCDSKVKLENASRMWEWMHAFDNTQMLNNLCKMWFRSKRKFKKFYPKLIIASSSKKESTWVQLSWIFQFHSNTRNMYLPTARWAASAILLTLNAFFFIRWEMNRITSENEK